MCVDVGREFGAPTNIFYKPPCVSVYRCGGCCHSEDKQCRNISTGYLSKTVSARLENPKWRLHRLYENISVLCIHAWEIQGGMSGQKCLWVLPASPANPERASEDRSRNSDVQAWLRAFHTDLVLWFSSYLTFHELQNLFCSLKQDVVGFFFVEFLKRDSWAVCACVCVCFVSAVSTHKVRKWRLLLLQPN